MYKRHHILAIDEGNEYTGYCVMDDTTCEVLDFGKIPNEEMLGVIWHNCENHIVHTVVIEKIESYGMPVGASVLDTCVWAGRFVQTAYELGVHHEWISRKEEKMCICNSMKANDATIRRALIDLFAKHDMKNGKGTKKNPDFFYGFKADCWAAFAVGYTYLEKLKERT